MFEALIVAVAIAACLGASALLWGTGLTRPRLLLSTALGIVAAVVAWMLLGNALTLPDAAVTALGVWLVVLTAVLVRAGLTRVAPGTA
jgi:hypothetical protein